MEAKLFSSLVHESLTLCESEYFAKCFANDIYKIVSTLNSEVSFVLKCVSAFRKFRYGLHLIVLVEENYKQLPLKLYYYIYNICIVVLLQMNKIRLMDFCFFLDHMGLFL